MTIIPLDSPTAVENGKLEELRRTALEKDLDPAVVDEMLKNLPSTDDDKHTSRSGFLNALQSLHWFQTKASIPSKDLNEFWVLVEDIPSERMELFLPSHLAEILSLLAECQRPSTELIRFLSRRCRKLYRSFDAPDIGTIVRAYGKLDFKSMETIKLLGSRLAGLLQDPEKRDTVTGSHIAALAGSYARLQLSWQKSRKVEQELKMWKTMAVALPRLLPEMTPREVSAVLNGFARLDFSNASIHSNVSQMFAATANHLVPRIALNSKLEFAPRDLGVISNAFAKIQAQTSTVSPLLKAVASSAVSQIESCNSLDLSQLLNAFAKLEVRDPPLFEAAAPVIISKMTEFDPQGLAVTAHAFGKQHVMHQALFEKIADASTRLMDRFLPKQLAPLAYALGKLQVRDKKLLRSLSDEVIYRGTIGKTLQTASDLYFFELTQLGILSQAFGRLAVSDHRLYFVLFDMTRQRVREFTRRVKDAEAERDVNASVHGVVDKSRVAAMASRGEDINMMTGRGLSSILTAFAKSKADFHSLIRWIPHQVAALSGQYSSMQLVQIFSASVTLGVKSVPMYSELLGFAKPRVPQMSPRDLAVLMASMPKAKMISRTVIRNAIKVMSAKASDLNVLDVCAAMVGCCELNYRDERFLRLLASIVRSRMNELTAAWLATVFANYSQMRIEHPAWFDAILFELFQRQNELREKDATKVAYAMLLLAAVERHEAEAKMAIGTSPSSPSNASSLLDSHKGVLYSMLAISNEHRSDLNYPAIYQLQIVELYLRLLAPSVYEDMRQELKILLAKARKVSVVVDDYMQNSSRLHRRISQWFMRVGLEHRSEVFVGPFMLDMLIGERVVVEVDGPSHFYRDTNTRTASSLLKNLLLRAMGFHVKHLPYQEWQQCGTAVKRTMYCSAFWKDVIAASRESKSSELNPRLPELVDILDVVTSWQVGQGPHPSRAFLQREKPQTQSLPAFYSEDGIESIDPSESIEEPKEAGSFDSFDIDSEQLGIRTPEDLIAAHEEAEAAMREDREQQITSQQRMRMDESLDRSDLSSDLRKLYPRSKRREVHHSTAGMFDLDALEADTDSGSDDEENTRTNVTTESVGSNMELSANMLSKVLQVVHLIADSSPSLIELVQK